VKVTVVATGIGNGPKSREELVKLVKSAPVPEVNYRELDRPTVIRNQTQQAALEDATTSNPDYLDIPAFLRRQAD
jgi:cell division protein FtsZ